MKKYNLIVLAGHTHWDVTVFATQITYGNHGSYVFYDDKTLVASYPIDRTIISSVEDLEEE